MNRQNFFCLLLALSLSNAVTAAEPEPEPEPKTPLEKKAPSLLRQIDSDEAQNIYRHRDIYAIGGEPNTKVQLSFKLRPVLSLPVYFAYSQMMFWEVTKDSRPFQDIDFNPELYYTHSFEDQPIQAVSLGLEHRSNGKADAESRSMDRVFLELESSIGRGAWRVHGTVRLYWVYDIDWQTNANIRRYAGFVSTRISLDGITEQLFPSKGELYLTAIPGGDWDTNHGHGALEFTAKYRFGLSDVMPYVMFQYYYGYMESLIEYNRFQKSYRIGLAF